MEHRVEIVEANELHAKDLAPRLRECDKEEIWAHAHMRPEGALWWAVNSTHFDETRRTFACLLDDEVVAIFGVADVPGAPIKTTMLWMLGSDDIYDHADLFHKHTAEWLERFREEYDLIFNYVDARNEAAIRWIEKVGFTLFPPAPYGVEEKMFHYFEWRAG